MSKKNKSLFAILMVALLVLVIGVTYAFITITLHGEKENTITGGSLTVTLNDTDSSLGNGAGDITISDAFPVTDAVGKTQTPYTFTLSNTSAKDASYTVYLDEDAIDSGATRMSDAQVKVYLTNGDGSSVLKDATKVSELGSKVTRTVNGKSVQGNVLYSSVLAAGQVNTFVLRLWISEDADETVMGKQYATKISVDAVQVPEYAVTVVNSISPVQTVSKAVFKTGTATLSVTAGTGTPSISCTNGMHATVKANGSNLDVTVPNVTAHTTCTISYTG